jgi:hypothetical protein
VVFDGIRGRPLAGAVVFVDGTARTTVSDAAGRFTLDHGARRPARPQRHPSRTHLPPSAALGLALRDHRRSGHEGVDEEDGNGSGLTDLVD